MTAQARVGGTSRCVGGVAYPGPAIPGGGGGMAYGGRCIVVLYNMY